MNETWLACTYMDLGIKNPNLPIMIWGNFSSVQDAREYIKKIRRRKSDTLWGAWDIYYETYSGSWAFNKPVEHFPPRKDHDYYGKCISDIKIALVEAIAI